jgi:hypothetical protein
VEGEATEHCKFAELIENVNSWQIERGERSEMMKKNLNENILLSSSLDDFAFQFFTHTGAEGGKVLFARF